MPSTVIGLDIGTTSVSAIAIRDDGRPQESVTKQHYAGVSGLPNGRAEQDPSKLLNSAVSALQQISSACREADIAAIGVTGQMHSTVLLDQQRRTLCNVITWQDRRSLEPCENGVSPLDELLRAVPSELMDGTGCRLSPGYMGTTLFALQRLKELPQNIHSVSFVADWVASELSGQSPVTDRSHAASSGLFDLQNDGWQPDLLTAASVIPDWLPDVRDSGERIGELTPTMADVTGIRAGTPICNAIGDNQASVISSLPSGDDALLINIGTGGQIVWRLPRFERINGMDTRYLPAASRNQEGLFMLVGAGLCGGDAVAWINRTVRQWLSEFGCEVSEADVWKYLNERLTAEALETESITCEPFFGGTRVDPQRRGVFAGVGLHNFTPANIAAGILRGIAESMHAVYVGAEGRRPEPLRTISMAGNGARRNPFLVDAVSRCFGVPVTVSPCQEEAATGAAMLAGVHAGLWPDVDAARQFCIVEDA